MQAALVDLNTFQAANGSLSAADLLTLEDVNGDGVVNNADQQSLLSFLIGGGNSFTSVPEPASGMLLGLAAISLSVAGFARANRRRSDNCRAA